MRLRVSCARALSAVGQGSARDALFRSQGHDSSMSGLPWSTIGRPRLGRIADPSC